MRIGLCLIYEASRFSHIGKTHEEWQSSDRIIEAMQMNTLEGVAEL